MGLKLVAKQPGLVAKETKNAGNGLKRIEIIFLHFCPRCYGNLMVAREPNILFRELFNLPSNSNSYGHPILSYWHYAETFMSGVGALVRDHSPFC